MVREAVRRAGQSTLILADDDHPLHPAMWQTLLTPAAPADGGPGVPAADDADGGPGVPADDDDDDEEDEEVPEEERDVEEDPVLRHVREEAERRGLTDMIPWDLLVKSSKRS